MLPKSTRCHLQVRKFSVPINAESRRVSWNVREICDVTRIEVQMLDEDRFHNLFSLLDLEEELSVVIDVVQNLTAQVLCQVVEEL